MNRDRFAWPLALTLAMGSMLLTPFVGRADTTETISEGLGPKVFTQLGSRSASISADGRFVAFVSDQPNLVPDDTNGFLDLFVRDRQTGITERVSLNNAGEESNRDSNGGVISADGRFVVFSSDATNLVPNDNNRSTDVFLFDRQLRSIERINISTSGAEADVDGLQSAAVSADGRFVAFTSGASNLVENDRNGFADVFVRDRQLGTTELVSVNREGIQQDGNAFAVSISADGRFVAFASGASNLVDGDANGVADKFVLDRQTGTIERVNVTSAGTEVTDENSDGVVQISGNGRFVLFNSFAPNVVPGDLNGAKDAFIRDRLAGTTERVSLSSSEEEGNAYSEGRQLSSDGRYVVLSSLASNLVSDDTNNIFDAFVRDRVTGTTERVSLINEGAEIFSPFGSIGTAISDDGRSVVFESDVFAGQFALDVLLRARANLVPTPEPLAIQIKVLGIIPGLINLRNPLPLEVVLLGSKQLDVRKIDATSLRLGPAAAPVQGRPKILNVDLDRDFDLIAGFRTQGTGVRSGDTEICVLGSTVDGRTIKGCSKIRVVGGR